MTDKLQCECCKAAKKGENLWYWDGEFLCVYCVVNKLCNATTENIVASGYVGQDKEEALKDL